MNDFRIISSTGLIIWTLTIAIYIISIIIIKYYYSRTTVSPYYKEVYHKFEKQNKFLIYFIRMIITILSLTILIGAPYFDTKKTVKLIFILIGMILPAYFLSLMGANLEEKSVARPVAEEKYDNKNDAKT